ncbi:filamentous hemagglutinin N-terminal domain-containing protein [Waterburya agarophytonicola K14]|uniref:Filamentous hemagglutinin N-terminal domain-containing protein n=1 Tax=Waterburya agarophytonicola KI4 TaxID=2874699 RepID=A0A964FF81_9CYAN|nr:filamentous hemagglutinin N-terminal domain-containing protein [Waterburya agarophytonicola]MCC0176636.1 filamentous hemagglutinin N-terminal domain-containing protein [Waterburya agarophytonicola KI4]
MLASIKSSSFLCLVAVISLLSKSAVAQINPDGTTSTTVTTEGNILTIDDGDRAGSNLFHSFQEFSVPNGNEAFFNNAADVTNIFSRVTGRDISNIDGLIRANNANLFLINPAGVIFGGGASLNLGGGSFYGSTADSILFEDGEFSATDLDNPPLLTVNAPIGLNFRDNPAPIQVNSSVLRVESGQNLILLGGELNLNDSVRMFTPGANVELGAISGGGTIELDENLRLNFPDDIALANIFLNNDIAVNVTSNDGGAISINANNLQLSGNSRLAAGIEDNADASDIRSGNITINATEDLTLEGNSQILNRVSSNGQGETGDIEISTGSNIILDGNSFIINEVADLGQGNAGNIQIATQSLTLNNSSFIGSQTFGQGNSGNVNINAENTIAINSGSSLRSLVRVGGEGNAGELNINTDVLVAETVEGTSENRSLIFSNTFGAGNAGNININATDSVTFDNSSVLAQVDEGASGSGGNVTINTPSLEVKNSASEVLTASGIFTDTKGTGNAGDINITIDDALTIDRRSSIGAGTTSEGNAGDIKIATDLLSLSNFALLATNVRENAGGDAGIITIDANDVDISEGALIDTSIIGTSRPIDFTGGEINIRANTLDLTTGGKISTNTSNSSANAGNLNLIIADRLTIDGSNSAVLPPEFREFLDPLLELESITGLLALTRLGATGNGGNINIISPNASIDIANGEAQISVSSFQAEGSGGSILIEAQNLKLNNNSSIFASTPSGQGGSISLKIEDSIILDNDSSITAQAFNDANGGNIDIDTNFIVAFPSKPNGSDITASAKGGDGGNINITAEEILGLQERTSTSSNGTNDIDASSEFGFDGSVSLETPDISSFQGIVELSTKVVESGDSVANVCRVDSGVGSSLALKGRGGTTPQPIEPMSSDYLLVDGTAARESKPTSSKIEDRPNQDGAIATGEGNIYPARDVIVKADGTLILTAVPGTNKLPQPPAESPNCLTNH